MMKILLACFLFLFTPFATAEGQPVKEGNVEIGTPTTKKEQQLFNGASFEIGTFLGTAGVSGSPVPVSSSSGNGYSLKAVVPLLLPELPSGKYSDYLNLRVTLGFDQRNSNISMGGISLGEYNRSTWSTTLRVYPLKTCKVCYYGGIGLYNEESDQSNMAGGVLVMNSASRTGFMVEAGINVMFPFLDGETLYGDLNLSNRFDPNRSEIKTNPGNALVTKIGEDEMRVLLSAGFKFNKK